MLGYFNCNYDIAFWYFIVNCVTELFSLLPTILLLLIALSAETLQGICPISQ